MVQMMDIMMAAVDEYARRMLVEGRGADLAAIGACMLVDEKTAWYLVDREVLTVNGEQSRKLN